jgi:D-glycero-alpha-D-manno-heptose-7-phosphate kinase
MAFMTRTPLRISLFGGGTDYPEYFHRHPGAVLGFAIDKYILISALKLRAYLEYNYRVSYSKLEFADRIEDIQHPVVRETLKMYGVLDRLDINVMSDLPAAGGGLGSSSAFTVGFTHLVSSMLGRPMSRMDLARTAMRIERDVLKENVGVQDQLHTAFGGVNRFDFEGDRFRISPVQLRGDTLSDINQSLVLIHSGVARRATATAASQVEATASKRLDSELMALYQLVQHGVELLESRSTSIVEELGRMLQEGWRIKRQLTKNITSDEIDRIYDTAMSLGAYGGKLCGAGGGGFIMMLMPPDRIPALAKALAPLAVMPTAIEMSGTTLLYSTNEKIESSMPLPAPRLQRVAGADG